MPINLYGNWLLRVAGVCSVAACGWCVLIGCFCCSEWSCRAIGVRNAERKTVHLYAGKVSPV